MTRLGANCSAVSGERKHVGLVPRLLRGRAAPTAISLLIAANFAFAQASPPSVATADPALEARVKALSAELRCLVCQNQTVADSDAPVARDMREQVRAQLAAGKSEADVKRYMTDRFGDFVLYKPPMKASTFVLWFAPFVVLAFGVLFLRRRLRASNETTNQTATLDDEARKKARALLDS
jgi:cytochrome c-type biogenesis protein CcmH